MDNKSKTQSWILSYMIKLQWKKQHGTGRETGKKTQLDGLEDAEKT